MRGFCDYCNGPTYSVCPTCGKEICPDHVDDRPPHLICSACSDLGVTLKNGLQGYWRESGAWRARWSHEDYITPAMRYSGSRIESRQDIWRRFAEEWDASGEPRIAALCRIKANGWSDLRQAAQEMHRRNEEGDIQGALVLANDLIALLPEDYNVRRMRAYLLGSLGRSNEALADWNLLITKHPKVAAAYAGRAAEFANLGQFADALSDAELAEQIGGDTPFLALLRGLIRAREVVIVGGEYSSAAALTDLDTAIQDDPNNWVARQWRAYVHLLVGNESAAVDDLEILSAGFGDNLPGLCWVV